MKNDLIGCPCNGIHVKTLLSRQCTVVRKLPRPATVGEFTSPECQWETGVSHVFESCGGVSHYPFKPLKATNASNDSHERLLKQQGPLGRTWRPGCDA